MKKVDKATVIIDRNMQRNGLCISYDPADAFVAEAYYEDGTKLTDDECDRLDVNDYLI